MMNRKYFLQTSLPLATVPFIANGVLLRGCGLGSLFNTAARHSTQPGRVLVLIQLDGGNDGLNTLIPLDQYSELSRVRQNILIPEKQVLPLQGLTATGLHPALLPLQKMYNNGHLLAVQGVGYPNPVFSHFRATDIWHTASGSETVLSTGWLGRYLNHEFPGYPVGYPGPNAPHPPAIQLGSSSSGALQGPAVGMGLMVGNSTDFYNLVLDQRTGSDATPAQRALQFIRTTATEASEYYKAIKQAANAQATLSNRYPSAGTNPLADQLKLVARMIGGGMQTKVYMVNLNEFDTHASQAEPGQPTKGKHARLLSMLAESIDAFTDDITRMQQADRVLGMTYSEFGRRIKSNASYGTDHGSSAPVFLFGTKLKAGILGHNPVIDKATDATTNLPMQYDFRSLYTTVLQNWFGLPSEAVNTAVGHGFGLLPLFA